MVSQQFIRRWALVSDSAPLSPSPWAKGQDLCGVFYDHWIVGHGYKGVSPLQQSPHNFQHTLDIVRVQAGGGLIQAI